MLLFVTNHANRVTFSFHFEIRSNILVYHTKYIFVCGCHVTTCGKVEGGGCIFQMLKVIYAFQNEPQTKADKIKVALEKLKEAKVKKVNSAVNVSNFLPAVIQLK